jgi:lysophospholipid acyltransferase (LPLAT)-like uncharacterized protein
MKLKHPLLQKAIGFGLACTARVLRRTIDWRAVYFDPTTDTAHPRHGGRFVYLGWHEYMVMPIILRGDQRMVALASGHSDGALIGRTMRHLGWNVAHGSPTARAGRGGQWRPARCSWLRAWNYPSFVSGTPTINRGA